MKRGLPQNMVSTQPPKVQKTVNVTVTSTGEFLSGTIKSYNAEKGWGLIESPEIPSGGGGQAGDVFFLKSHLPTGTGDADLKGQTVSYELFTTDDGKFRAQNIVIT